MLNTLFTAFVSGLGVALAILAIYPSTRIWGKNIKMSRTTKLFSNFAFIEVFASIVYLATGASNHDYINLITGLLWLVPALLSAHKITKTQEFKETTK